MNEITLRELNHKIDAIIDYLKENGGYYYKIYNHTCPAFDNEPDSNIVEYAEDIKDIIYNTNNKYSEDLPF